jgi:hypothetical protein
MSTAADNVYQVTWWCAHNLCIKRSKGPYLGVVPLLLKATALGGEVVVGGIKALGLVPESLVFITQLIVQLVDAGKLTNEVIPFLPQGPQRQRAVKLWYTGGRAVRCCHRGSERQNRSRRV